MRRWWAYSLARSATSSRSVAFRYIADRSSYGNIEHVAPISAPMLQIVALPVAEIDSHPGPKYSTIAPVPPFTVRMPATLRMTSLGAVHPDNRPVRRTPMTFGTLVLNGQPAMTSTAWAAPTPIATMPRPYFAETVRRNSYTSELESTAFFRSISAPTRA